VCRETEEQFHVSVRCHHGSIEQLVWLPDFAVAIGRSFKCFPFSSFFFFALTRMCGQTRQMVPSRERNPLSYVIKQSIHQQKQSKAIIVKIYLSIKGLKGARGELTCCKGAASQEFEEGVAGRRGRPLTPQHGSQPFESYYGQVGASTASAPSAQTRGRPRWS
jgi:hypothetical protein